MKILLVLLVLVFACGCRVSSGFDIPENGAIIKKCGKINYHALVRRIEKIVLETIRDGLKDALKSELEKGDEEGLVTSVIKDVKDELHDSQINEYLHSAGSKEQYDNFAREKETRQVIREDLRRIMEEARGSYISEQSMNCLIRSLFTYITDRVEESLSRDANQIANCEESLKNFITHKTREVMKRVLLEEIRRFGPNRSILRKTVQFLMSTARNIL